MYHVRPEATVLEACTEAGIYVSVFESMAWLHHRSPVSAGQTAPLVAALQIPTLCNHPRLPTSPGTCKLCQVDLGEGKCKPACKTPVAAGMKAGPSVLAALGRRSVGKGWEGAPTPPPPMR